MSVSDGLEEAISAAIHSHLSEHGGGIITGLACVITYIDSDGDRAWATVQAENQSAEQTLGMMRFYTLSVERDLAAYFDTLDDDE